MRLTIIFLFFLGIANALPQGLLSDIAGALGFTDSDPTPTPAQQTLDPPAVATTSPANARPSKSNSPNAHTKAPSTASDNPFATTGFESPDSNPTTAVQSSNEPSTITSSTSPTISSTLITTTSTPSPPPTTSSSTTSTAPVPAVTSQSSQPSSSSSSPPAGGIAVGVIMSIAVIAFLIWLLFRYHPGVRSRYLEWEEKRRQERSYRAGLDGPFASKGLGGFRSHDVRDEALGSSRPTTSASSRRSVLSSFFAPRTVRLGNGQEIRRKPVNWGAGAPEVPPIPMPEMMKSHSSVGYTGNKSIEKVALTDMAAPMGRNASTKTFVSEMEAPVGRNESTKSFVSRMESTNSTSGGNRGAGRDIRSNVSSVKSAYPGISVSPVSAQTRDFRSNVSSPTLMQRDLSVSSRGPGSPQVELPGSNQFGTNQFGTNKPLPRLAPSPMPNSPLMRNELPGSSPIMTRNELPGSSPVVHAAPTPPPISPPTAASTPISQIPPSISLPAIPVPAVPADPKKDVHQILSRKSIFELGG